jgi:hypothetical protein
MASSELLEKNKAFYVKNFITLDLAKFFTNVLMRQSVVCEKKGDSQVPNAVAILSHEVMFETLLERAWPITEELTGKELIPTYAHSRLYTNGDTLNVHIDRPACEISVTLQLGRSHHYAWPIYMGGHRIDMAEGDAVIYKGQEIEHFRLPCDGPENYYSGQVFLHYVDANGPYAQEHGCDATHRPLVKNMFVKNRSILMDNK